MMVLLGLACLSAGVILKIYDSRKEAFPGHATARVVDLVRRDENGRFRSRYYPVLEYYAEGLLYKVIYPEGSYPAKWNVGEELKLLYEPADPETFQVVETGVRGRLPQYLQLGGTLLLMTGIVLFLCFASR